MATETKAPEIKGLKGIVRAMRRYDENVVAAMKVINRAGAERVAARARMLAPRKTGRLAASVRAGATTYAGVVRVGGARLPYAMPIVYGWPAHNIEKQPFPYDALQAEWQPVHIAYEREMSALALRTFPHGEPMGA